jgi:hypothetical protein
MQILQKLTFSDLALFRLFFAYYSFQKILSPVQEFLCILIPHTNLGGKIVLGHLSLFFLLAKLFCRRVKWV